MTEMISRLFINSTIMVSSVMLANMVMRDRYFHKSVKNSLINGFLSGLLGCILMIYSVSLAPNIIIDFRFVPIIMMGLYVSSIAAIETAVIIGTFRIAYWGLDRVTIIALIVAMVVGIGCSLIGKSKYSIATKWIYSVLLVCVSAGAGVYSVTIHLKNHIALLLVFISATVIMSALMYFLIEYVAEFNRKYEKLKEDAERDFLTGLKNPRQFYKSLNRYFDVETADQRHVSLLYIDVDHFKAINDTYGHENGDIVLQALGKIFKLAARSHDIISRKGGEEFAILLVECSETQAIHAAERIRKAVESHEFKLKDHRTVNVTISIGISSIPEKTTSVSEMIEQADKALYAAKHAGRNRVMIAS